MFSKQNLSIFLIISLVCLLLSFSGCTNANAAFIGTSSPIEISQYNQLGADVNSIGLTDGYGILNYFKLSDLNLSGGGVPFDANCPIGEVLKQVDSNGGYVCVVASAGSIDTNWQTSGNFSPDTNNLINIGDINAEGFWTRSGSTLGAGFDYYSNERAMFRSVHPSSSNLGIALGAGWSSATSPHTGLPGGIIALENMVGASGNELAILNESGGQISLMPSNSVGATDYDALQIKFTGSSFSKDVNIGNNLKTDGNVRVNGNYLCDSTNCYLISDLNINNGGSTGNFIDTNWQTSFPVFDANMKATYLQLPSTSPLSLPTLVNGQYLTNNGTTLNWSAISSSVDTNTYTAGIMRADNNALLIDLNGGGKSLFGFLDGNFTRNVFIDGNLTLNGVIKHSTCPSGYVLVPGDSNFGTNDFCVMKYEAKANSIYQPISVAAGTPWVSISWYSAKDACKRAGAHLITNAEWMTIARNIESQTINWQSGSVGTRCMFGGHMDNLPTSALAASTDDDPYYGTNSSNQITETCPFVAGSDNKKASKRTFTLSNGSVVWDISGNVWEWVDEQCDPVNWDTTSWTEWSASAMNGYKRSVAGPSRVDFNSSTGSGRYYGCSSTNGLNMNGNGLLRGAAWGDGVSAGAFTLSFNRASSYSDSYIGFRCVR